MKQLLYKTSCVMMVFLTSSLSIVSTYSHATTSGGTSSSSSASSSSSSSAASASRGSTSSSTSMSRSSAINASRNAQQSSQRAAQQTTKSSRVTATKNKGQQSVSSQKAQSRSLMPSQRPYDSSAPYSSQYIATTYYNNWLFYYIFAYSFLNQHEKKNSVDAQFNMLKQQMKPHEKLYTITVKTKQGKRVIVVPKKQYDKIEKGKHIKVKNGVVQ